MTSNRVVSACAVLLLALAAPSVFGANLYYRLASELAKNHGPGAPHTSFNGVCQGDQDNDCLDDAMEWELIQKLNPRYYLDFNENCPRMYVYAQVRPAGPSVDVWRVDGRMKWVDVTYFYDYEKDCKDIGGHRGDSEHVRYFLSSQDLKTWTLDHAVYWRHSDSKTISGAHLAMMGYGVDPTRTGQPDVPPIVAADKDGHGSWEGKALYSDDCTADTIIFPPRACFDRSTVTASHSTRPLVLHNIGGPDGGRFSGPEHWRPHPMHLTVSGSEVFTVRNNTREHWTPSIDFCGWQCPMNEPACRAFGCSGSLQGKLDTAAFSRQSRPITAAEYGASYTYECTFSRNGGPETPNKVTWTYQGQNPEGHLLYTATDIGGTHYYRIWYLQTVDFGERWILESVAPNDWRGPAQVTCNQFDVNIAGTTLLFNWWNACSNGVKQRCWGYP